MFSNNIIQSRSVEYKVGQGEGHYQDRYIYQNNYPPRQIAQVMNAKS